MQLLLTVLLYAWLVTGTLAALAYVREEQEMGESGWDIAAGMTARFFWPALFLFVLLAYGWYCLLAKCDDL